MVRSILRVDTFTGMNFNGRVEKDDLKEAAWIVTKLARLTISQKLLELNSEKGKHFSYMVTAEQLGLFSIGICSSLATGYSSMFRLVD